MIQDTRIALFLLAELVAALQANDHDTFKRWLYGGIQDLGEPAVAELLLDWIDPFITRVERDRMVAWHLGVSLYLECGGETRLNKSLSWGRAFQLKRE